MMSAQDAGSTTPPPPLEEEKRKRGRPRKKALAPDYREARTGLILARKLANARTEEICEEFKISRATVYRALSEARKSGLVAQARDWLTLNAVPLSLAAIEEVLRDTRAPQALKVDTAFRVLDGLGITGKHALLTVQAEGAGTESFETFRAQVTKTVTLTRQGREPGEPPAPAGRDAGEHPGVHLGDVVEALPGSETGPGAGGGEGKLARPDGGSRGEPGPLPDGPLTPEES